MVLLMTLSGLATLAVGAMLLIWWLSRRSRRPLSNRLTDSGDASSPSFFGSTSYFPTDTSSTSSGPMDDETGRRARHAVAADAGMIPEPDSGSSWGGSDSDSGSSDSGGGDSGGGGGGGD